MTRVNEIGVVISPTSDWRRAGLAQPLRRELGVGPDAGSAVRAQDGGSGVRERALVDSQQRSGASLHRPAVSLTQVEARGVQVSMDGKGRAVDNIFTERLWQTVKHEEVYIHSYESPRVARQGLAQYLSFYNQGRPHQALGYHTSQEMYSDT